MRFRDLAHADVANCGCDQGSFGTYQRTQHDLDRKLAAILPLRNELDSRAYLLRRCVLRRSKIIRDEAFRETHRNDVCDLLPEEFVAAIAKLLFRLNI